MNPEWLKLLEARRNSIFKICILSSVHKMVFTYFYRNLYVQLATNHKSILNEKKNILRIFRLRKRLSQCNIDYIFTTCTIYIHCLYGSFFYLFRHRQYDTNVSLKYLCILRNVLRKKIATHHRPLYANWKITSETNTNRHIVLLFQKHTKFRLFRHSLSQSP